MAAQPQRGVDFIREANLRNEARDAALRPLTFEDFTGQRKTVERLRIMTGAALKRGDVMAHVLLSGPPGLGKTTLAFIIGATMGRQVHLTSGPAVDKPLDLAGMLTNLKDGDILFIDEIHRLPRVVEEYLYSAMEDFRLEIIIDQGPHARSVQMELARFTLIGATTRVGLLTPPLRSRFTLQSRLDYYEREDLERIIRRSCGLLGVAIDGPGAREIAARARGTPRVANNLIRFVRDYAEERAGGKITRAVAREALTLLEIDEHGLDEMDKRVLTVMAAHYKGGPVGLGTIAVAVGEERHTLEEVHEPYLIQEGYLKRTPQGRVLTDRGWRVAGLDPRGGGQLELGV